VRKTVSQDDAPALAWPGFHLREAQVANLQMHGGTVFGTHAQLREVRIGHKRRGLSERARLRATALAEEADLRIRAPESFCKSTKTIRIGGWLEWILVASAAKLHCVNQSLGDAVGKGFIIQSEKVPAAVGLMLRSDDEGRGTMRKLNSGWPSLAVWSLLSCSAGLTVTNSTVVMLIPQSTSRKTLSFAKSCCGNSRHILWRSRARC
jgi:hypothetical protein